MDEFRPWLYVQSLDDIEMTFLYKEGIRYAICDWDGTLWNRAGHLDSINCWQLRYWVNSGAITGFLVLTNAVCEHKKRKEKRIRAHLGKIRLFPDAVLCLGHECRKPLPAAFERAREEIPHTYAGNKVVVIGDQIVSDVAGGNRAGFRTVLVNSVGREGLTTIISGRAARNAALKKELGLTPRTHTHSEKHTP